MSARAAVVAALAISVAGLASGDQAKPASSPAAPPPNMEQVYLVLLKKGRRSGEENPDRKAIQEGHMANIRAMWQAKKLIIAGPMGDDGDIRGIFIFRVPTLEEAQALVASDPAVKAGRLAGEIHPWWIEKGTLPAAGEYCVPRR